jgi:dTDP-3,4-didehydro-2,6-dideoxy-alpha-D-glucose 3-reductase
MSRDIRWGILGVGRVTERMVVAIRSRPGHRISIAAGRDPLKLQAWGVRHQVDGLTQDLLEVIDSSEVDIVYVALPPALHAEWITRALRAGKRVLCEKPLALDSESCEAMIQVSRDCSIPLSHATGFVHHPRSHAMRAVVRSGELGSIQRVAVACTFSSVAERENDHRFDAMAGGGCLLDLGWYCAYATLWFTGLQPVAIKSFGSRRGEGSDAVWNHVQAMARLEGGATASLGLRLRCGGSEVDRDCRQPRFAHL